MKKVLLWDFDGTLIHSNESFLDALQNALENLKYKIPTDEIRQFLHAVCSWYTPDVLYTENTGQKWWDNLFNRFDSFYDEYKIVNTDRKNIDMVFKNRILDYKNYTLYDDAKTVLYECRKMGYKNYILSNNYPELPIVIKDLGISDYFTDYVVSSHIGYEKPRIEIFQYALNVAGLPDICYMIGDNPIADIQGGKSVGITTILVHTDSTFDTDYKCSNLSEIPLILK